MCHMHYWTDDSASTAARPMKKFYCDKGDNAAVFKQLTSLPSLH